jgi:homocitrate synthase
MDDAKIAVETGVDGLDVVIGTSSILREFSHGKDMNYITEKAIEVVNFIKSKGLEVRFSSEDSFRSDLVDLLNIYRTMDRVRLHLCYNMALISIQHRLVLIEWVLLIR